MIHMLLALSLSLATAVPVITLERGACFGSCPVYKLTIYDDGTVEYEGKEFVRLRSKAKGQITQEALQELIREFEKIDYLKLDDSYEVGSKNCPESWTDHPLAITSLNWQGKQKKIRHYHGCRGLAILDQLTALENKIDEVVNTRRWTK
jgi:hypothetical protein